MAASRGTPASGAPLTARTLAPFAVVGPGRVGTALATSWVRAGLPCLGLLGRDRRRTERARRQVRQGQVLSSLAELRAAAVVLLAVPDAALAEVARAAARAGAVRAGSLWLHCSGFHDRGVLAPVRRRGAQVGSLHPLCPFPDPERGRASLRECHAFVEGDPAALPRLRRLAALLGSPTTILPSRRKPLYHAGAVLGSNYVVLLLDLARRCVARALGARGEATAAARTARQAVAQLAIAAIRQSAAAGPRAALTGPVRRGDVAVVRAHRAALVPEPSAARVYVALGREVVGWLARERVLPAGTCRALARALSGRNGRG